MQLQETKSNGGILFISFIIPIVGLLIGIIQLGTGNRKGGETIAVSIVAWIFWMIVVMGFIGAAAGI